MSFETTTQLVAALQAGTVSAAELLERAIARIEAHDGAINAVVVRDLERARAAAAQADAALARGERRALLGVPMTVKEAIDVAGLPTTWGIPGTQGIPVREDAVAVQRLKAAGAVILGKTNVPVQLADWQSFNPIYGVTNNPWDLARTPGGSSGGAAAALAAGFVPLELGTDMGGSLRVPAHCCGVFAHKPSHGLVPMRGVAPPGVPRLPTGTPAEFAVVGPLARSAADLSLALDVLAGPDVVAATAYRLALPPARHASLAAYRVLVLDTHPLVPTSSEVRAALHRFAEGLARHGCRLATGSPLVPDLRQVAETFHTLLMAFLGADMPDVADPLSHSDWVRADRVRAGLGNQWRELFREWDIVLCPVAATTAFAHDHAPMERRRLRVDGAEIPYEMQALWITLASIAGLPATSIPAGLGESGLPVGVQAIGPLLEDRTPLAFAALVERELGGFVPPPASA